MRSFVEDDWTALAILAAAVLMIMPLWLVDVPAMPDYPAHLASFYLIAGSARDAAFSHYYFIQCVAIPNLAFEFLVPLLMPLVGVAIATKFLLSTAVAMWTIAALRIHRALFGRIGLGPLGAVFFAYNDNFMWGFFNYYLSAGLALLAFSAWISTGAWNRTLRTSLFAAATLIVYFCHVFGAALLLLLIGCYEISVFLGYGRVSLRAALERAVPMIFLALPTALAFLFLKPSGQSAPVAFRLSETFQDRFESAIALNFDRPNYPVLAALILFLVLGFWRRWVSVHRDMKLVLAAVGVLCLIMPEEAMGGWAVDLRLPAVLGVLAFAAIRVDLPQRARGGLMAAALAAIAWNAAALAGNWQYYDRQYHEFRSALAGLPTGVRLMTVLDGDAMGLASDQPYWHMAEFAVLDRAGFTPLLFTTWGQHIVHVRPGLESDVASSARQGSPPDISELDDLAAGQVDGDEDIANVFPYLMRFQCKYDDAVLVHLGGKRSPVPDMLRLRHAGSFFSLYDIRHDGCRSP